LGAGLSLWGFGYLVRKLSQPARADGPITTQNPKDEETWSDPEYDAEYVNLVSFGRELLWENKFSEAEKSFRQAYDLVKDGKSEKMLLSSALQLSEAILRQKDRIADSLEIFRETTESLKRLGASPQTIIEIMMPHCDTLLLLRRPEEASVLAEEIDQHFRRIYSTNSEELLLDERFQTYTIAVAVRVKLALGDFDAAAVLLDDLLGKSGEQPNQMTFAINLFRVRVALLQDRVEAATSLTKVVLDRYGPGISHHLCNALQDLVVAHMGTGHFGEALELIHSLVARVQQWSGDAAAIGFLAGLKLLEASVLLAQGRSDEGLALVRDNYNNLTMNISHTVGTLFVQPILATVLLLGGARACFKLHFLFKEPRGRDATVQAMKAGVFLEATYENPHYCPEGEDTTDTEGAGGVADEPRAKFLTITQWLPAEEVQRNMIATAEDAFFVSRRASGIVLKTPRFSLAGMPDRKNYLLILDVWSSKDKEQLLAKHFQVYQYSEG